MPPVLCSSPWGDDGAAAVSCRSTPPPWISTSISKKLFWARNPLKATVSTLREREMQPFHSWKALRKRVAARRAERPDVSRKREWCRASGYSRTTRCTAHVSWRVVLWCDEEDGKARKQRFRQGRFQTAIDISCLRDIDDTRSVCLGEWKHDFCVSHTTKVHIQLLWNKTHFLWLQFGCSSVTSRFARGTHGSLIKDVSLDRKYVK